MKTLYALRLAAGLTAKELSESAGVNPGTVSRIERGLASPTLAVARKLADALGVDLSAIEFGGRS